MVSVAHIYTDRVCHLLQMEGAMSYQIFAEGSGQNRTWRHKDMLALISGQRNFNGMHDIAIKSSSSVGLIRPMQGADPESVI